MVRHQAVGPDLGACLLSVLGNEPDLAEIVTFTEKGFLSAIPSLSYVMRIEWNN
jgi:hypothetical protein